MTSAEPVVETKELTKKYGDFVALDRLTMAIERGQILGFIGPNGAGKTTTMRILATLLNPTWGEATVCGYSIYTGAKDIRRAIVAGVDCAAEPRRIKRLIGYMPDVFGTYDNMRVSEYLDFFGAAFGIPRRGRAQRIDAVLDTVGAAHFKDLYVESLSHGMKQRVAIARTLLHDPEVLILDEPTNGLDPQARIEVRQILLDLAGRGKTLIVTSHVLPELSRICHRVAIITRGRLRAFGTVAEVTRQLSPLREMEVLLARADQIDRVVEVIRGHLEPGASVRSSPAEGVVRFHTARRDEDLAALLAALVAAGLEVSQFGEVQTDLEEAFLSVARSDASAAAADGETRESPRPREGAMA